jgi:polyphenol oxidase
MTQAYMPGAEGLEPLSAPSTPPPLPVPLVSPILAGLKGVRHGFFTRQGGVSQGLYASLNCGFGSQDDPAAIAVNRALVAKTFGITAERLLTAHQTHSTDVVCVNGPWNPGGAPKADALITQCPQLAIAALAADCVPILIAVRATSYHGPWVGAIHAGWRGVFGGIIARVLTKLAEAYAIKAEEVFAAIGPAIGPESYEVGPEFCERVAKYGKAYEGFLRPSLRAGHFFLDLPGWVAKNFEQHGVQHIDLLRADTFALEEQFFSFRRNSLRGYSDYGRGISAILLSPQ